MTPTDAQIERAAKALEEFELDRGDLATYKDMAKTALTAAAEVGEREHSPEWHIIQSTIERCAQVAEQLFEMEYDQAYGQEVADAIRALKDKPVSDAFGGPFPEEEP